ncbi:MAG: hypothetical protein HDT47_04960 [Ruminococcaceae bacterium]|nr:hypothetical protein [Oscillospiraceae bacterium]
MATKSISKSVKIRSRKAGESLFEAIEGSRKSSNATVRLKSSPQRVEKNDIKDFFGKTVK